MEVFVVLNGKKEGPLTLYQLQEWLREGKVDGSTRGWMRGQDRWVSLRDLPAVLGVIQGMERERLDEELAERGRPAVPPEPEISYRKLPAHGMARYGARMIDVLMAQLVLMFLVGLPAVPEGFPKPGDYGEARDYLWRVMGGEIPAEEKEYLEVVAMIQLGGLAGFWVLEAVLLAVLGATPGKWLFRLRVESDEGGRPGFFRALGRTFLVFWLGMAGRIPLLEWVANFLAFQRLQSRGTAWWDDQMCTVVRQDAVSRQRILLILLIFLAMTVLVLVIPSG